MLAVMGESTSVYEAKSLQWFVYEPSGIYGGGQGFVARPTQTG